MLESLPNRPLYLHEVKSLKDNSNKINNSEALFYEQDNINGVVCFFMNISDTGYIIVFNSDESEWIKLSHFNDTESNKEYDEGTDSILDWMNEHYENYGVYGMQKEEI